MDDTTPPGLPEPGSASIPTEAPVAPLAGAATTAMSRRDVLEWSGGLLAAAVGGAGDAAGRLLRQEPMPTLGEMRHVTPDLEEGEARCVG